MSNMKPQKKKSGNKNPLPRQPCADVDDEEVKEQFEKYVRKMGVQHAFNLHSYHNLDAPNGTCSRSMAKLIDLLWVMAKLSPKGEIKWRTLRQAVKHVVDLFGGDLLKSVNTEAHLKPGAVADSLFTLLYHVRRTMRRDDEFDKVMAALDDTTIQDFKKLREYMFGGRYSTSSSSLPCPSVTSSKTLVARDTDATLDSDGYPAPSFEVDDGEEYPSPAGLPSGKITLAAEALAASPPPVIKKDWRDEALKKPAASKKAVAPATTPSKPVVKMPKAKAMKSKMKGTLDFKINPLSVSIGGGKNQTYIQHIPKGASSKQLIVAVNSNMVEGLKCSHKEAINMLLPMCKKADAKKSHVLAARAKLLKELSS